MIAAYALYRRSRAHQDLSIDEQRQEIRTWAAVNGYQVVQEFEDDRSGLDTDRRSGFLALLRTCEKRQRRAASVVLVYDISRFSRLEPDEAAYHEHSLRRVGVRVIYTHDVEANTSGMAGHVVKSIKRAMAHEYSLKLSQVVQRGLRAHAERGEWTGGRPAYGYRRAIRQAAGAIVLLPDGRWKARGEHLVLVVDAREAAVVLEIYDLYVHRGWGLGAIADLLNARFEPPPTSGRQQGGRPAWTKSTLWTLLRNPAYIGRRVFGKARYSEIGRKRGKVARPAEEHVIVDNAIPAILDEVLWTAAQARHGRRRFGVGRPWHRPYLLSSLIQCGVCGKRFIGHKQSRGTVGAYYVCGSYLAAGVSVCSGLRVAVPYLEDAVADGIAKRLDRILDREVLRARVTALLEADATPNPGERAAAVETELAAVRVKLARLVDALADGTTGMPTVRAKLTELERDRRRLDGELAALRGRASAGSAPIERAVDELLESLGRLPAALASGEPEERKRVVRAFLAGIRIEKTTRQAVLSWYRLPRLDDVSVKLVELRGLEPLTPRLPALCSPS